MQLPQNLLKISYTHEKIRTNQGIKQVKKSLSFLIFVCWLKNLIVKTWKRLVNDKSESFRWNADVVGIKYSLNF